MALPPLAGTLQCNTAPDARMQPGRVCAPSPSCGKQNSGAVLRHLSCSLCLSSRLGHGEGTCLAAPYAPPVPSCCRTWAMSTLVPTGGFIHLNSFPGKIGWLMHHLLPSPPPTAFRDNVLSYLLFSSIARQLIKSCVFFLLPPCLLELLCIA